MAIEQSSIDAAASTDIDAALLASVERGDEQALAELFRRYSKLVFSVALRVLRDSAAAEDVLQEVFLHLWRRPAGFIGTRGSLGGWLAIIARNRSIDVLRRKRPTESIDDVPIASDYDLATDVARIILLERARLVIAALPVEQRRALEMAFYDGMTHVEIAEKLGDPLGTVKTRIRSAIQALTKAFKA